MTTGPRGTRHLALGLLLIVAGIFFVFGGLGDRHTALENREAILISNEGGNMEGHTPRGFSGSGTGLFAGDNLNQNFPNTDGVQLFLSFPLEEVKEERIRSAVLFSDNLHIRGNPFENLGSLLVKDTTYETFSSKVWNNEAGDIVCEIEQQADSFVSCDITDHLEYVLLDGREFLQFIVHFEKITDGDGEPDLALFYKSDSNTNEKGLFMLRVNDEQDQGPLLAENISIEIPIVLHRVVDSGDLSTKRSKEDTGALFENVERIWSQGNITFDTEIIDTEISEDIQETIMKGNFGELYALTVNDPLSFHVYFLQNIGGPNGIAFPPLNAVIADKTTVPDYRATAHELGHLLGLSHTDESRGRLLFQGADGELLTAEEIKTARRAAEEFVAEIERRNEQE